MSSYEEALAKQRGAKASKPLLDRRRENRKKLIGIRTYVKADIPNDCTIFLAYVKGQGAIPCAHILNGHEQGDLLMAQIALIGPSSLPKMEVSNDNPQRLRD